MRMARTAASALHKNIENDLDCIFAEGPGTSGLWL